MTPDERTNYQKATDVSTRRGAAITDPPGHCSARGRAEDDRDERVAATREVALGFLGRASVRRPPMV
jgi:hypothetical protein